MRRLLRALLGLFGLAALLVGLPAGLLIAGRAEIGQDFLTRTVVDPASLFSALLQRGSTELLLALLVVVGLLAWALFAVAVLVEVVALVGKFRTPHIAGIGWAQGAAAALLGLVILASPTTQGVASAAASPTPAAASSVSLT